MDTRLDRIEARLDRLEAAARFAQPTPPPQPVATAPGALAPAPVLAARSHSTLEALLAGRGLQIAGFVLVLVGAAFFLDLAFTRGWIGPAQRILLGLAGGGGLVAFAATRLAGPYRRLAEALAGLGAGIVYLSLWAPVHIFPELHVSRGLAFAAMIAVTALLGALAATRRSQAVAIYGTLGGFLTPFLLGGGPSDQLELALYLGILAIGTYAIARRCSFAALEVLGGVGLLAYAPSLAPSSQSGWTLLDAQLVTGCYAAIVGAGLTLGAAPKSDGARRLRLSLIAVDAFAYMGVTASMLADHQTVLGENLFGFAAVLLAIGRVRALGPAFTRTYGYLGLAAVTLALPALLHQSALIDALSLEGVVLFALGRRGDVNVARGGVAVLAFAGMMLAARMLGATGLPLWQFDVALALWLACAWPVVASIDEIVPVDSAAMIAGLARVSFDLMALAGISHVIDDVANQRYGAIAFGDFENVALSLAWAAYGALLFALGLRGRRPLMRWEALALFGATIVKVFVVDLSTLELAYRVGSFVGLGVVLFAVSAWYTRATAAPAAESAP